MKLVDEKGKLFGKINIIDLLALVVLAAVVVFAATRFLGGEGGNPTASTTKLTYTVLVSGANPQSYEEVARQLEMAGGTDQLMANGNMLDAYVTHLEARPHINYSPNEAGVISPSEEVGENARVDLYFTVEANVANPIVNGVGTQEVRVGKGHILKTTHFEFSNGLIMTCDWG